MQKGISYYLGIDGGGTKTAFVLANGRGRVLERLTLGACNPNDVGFEETFAVLKRGILTVCSGYPMEEISVFAGLAGCSSAENMPRITAFLSTFGFGRYKNHNDAVSAVSAALQGADGIAVTMGTGSIAYAKRGEELFRIGGYGYLFGDEGSGFALGRDAILAALQYEDGSGEKTLLYDLVRAQCGGQTVLSRIDHFYAEGKREIARYAPLVFKGVKEEDAVSKKILQKNLSAIAAMIRGGAARLSTEEIPVVLCGGLTAQGQILLPMLGALLSEDGVSYRISICDQPPVYGALLLAGMPAGECFLMNTTDNDE